MRRRNLIALAIALASGTMPAAAQQLTIVRAARMLDVRTGRLVSPAAVTIEGDRIRSVGQPAQGAAVIDLGDVTLLPGLIDAHTHLTLDTDPEAFIRTVRDTEADDALRGARNARRTLLAGFTTVRDLGGLRFADVALARAIDAGWVEGPHMVPATWGIGITGGHADITGFAPGVMEIGPKEGVVDGVDEAVKAVRYQIKHGAKVIKVAATAGVYSFEGPVAAQQLSDEELRAIVAEASRHGLKVAAHAHGSAGILAAVRAGVASIEHGSQLTDEAIALMRQRGTYLVPTAYVSSGLELHDMPPAIVAKARAADSMANASHHKAFGAGLKIAFGSDAGVFPHGENAKEFAVLVERGLSPLEAIRAATVYAADLLGMADRGVIAPGTIADLVAVPGNPLQDVRVLERVAFVMQAGRVVKRPGAM